MKPMHWVFIACLVWATCAHGSDCSRDDSSAAEAALDGLDSWEKLAANFQKFRRCDEGVVAEGNSEAIARLLVDKWESLPQLGQLTANNLPLKNFILRHIDGSLDVDDVKKIAFMSQSSCPGGMNTFCGELNSVALSAIKAIGRN